MRSHDMIKIAPNYARDLPGLFSVECWGGATFDVAYRFLQECPWQRLRDLRAAMPNVMTQMLLRGSNGVGYTNYPDNVVQAFVKQAAETGIDLFRVFDPLTHVLGLKDMGGLVKPRAATALVKALKEEVGLPIHFHTHDTAGIALASIMAASDAGVDAVDCAMDSLSGNTSQATLGTLVEALRHSDRETGLDIHAIRKISNY